MGFSSFLGRERSFRFVRFFKSFYHTLQSSVPSKQRFMLSTPATSVIKRICASAISVNRFELFARGTAAVAPKGYKRKARPAAVSRPPFKAADA